LKIPAGRHVAGEPLPYLVLETAWWLGVSPNVVVVLTREVGKEPQKANVNGMISYDFHGASW